ncbi:MAG: SDR family oxidoreductase [Planctomycetes bacterium]|nr:SDR family oxidoreductase [Planctomycetota bacterium]MCH8119290.1 SDR family oxidoreductase [Planctomycetota bacterium]
MAKQLASKVAIVTGASRGIGRAISVALAQEAATVVLAARSIRKLQETADQVTKAGGKAQIVVTELTEEESIKNLVKVTNEKFSRLDILVNNAGVTHSANLEETTTEDWERCMQVNARAPFILCREALGLLRKSQAGYIINIASVVGVKGYPLQSAYTSSKHALRGMTISLAEELRDSNIRVHLLCPGGVDTELVQKVRPDIKRDELMQPEEIAELVLYLITHKGNAVIDELHIRRATSTPWF